MATLKSENSSPSPTSTKSLLPGWARLSNIFSGSVARREDAGAQLTAVGTLSPKAESGLTQQRRHEILGFDACEHSRNVLLAVLLLVGKVAKCLFPKTGLLFPIQLANLHHLPVLPILHMVMHDLLETGEKRDIQRADKSW